MIAGHSDILLINRIFGINYYSQRHAFKVYLKQKKKKNEKCIHLFTLI